MNQSLKYLDYTKRRLSVLLEVDTVHSFFNPVTFLDSKVYQVEININKVVRIFDGEKWEVCNDENLLFKIICRLLKKEVQQEIDYKEAV